MLRPDTSSLVEVLLSNKMDAQQPAIYVCLKAPLYNRPSNFSSSKDRIKLFVNWRVIVHILLIDVSKMY